MEKVLLMAIAFLFSTATLFGAHPTTLITDTAKTKKVNPAKVQYTCKMHPDYISDKPGKCPKCGMTLVKKEPVKKPAAIKE